jgi:hypothetical protein
MALCDPAVDMLLWKLAPINDISDNAACTGCNTGHAVCCSLAAVSPPRKVLRSSDATCQRLKKLPKKASCVLA